MKKDELPIIVFKRKDGISPLDITIRRKNIKCTQIVLDLIEKFQDNPQFNFLVDEHLCRLINMNIDLKDYLESSLLFYQIQNDLLPSMHSNDTQDVYGFNVEDCRQIAAHYEEFMGSKLEEMEDQNFAIEYFMVNLPDTLTKNPRELMKTLSDSGKIELFES
jgi:hypothetical protein